MPYDPKIGNTSTQDDKAGMTKCSEVKPYVLPASNAHTVASKPMTDPGKSGGGSK
jgi:hypothetical protein